MAYSLTPASTDLNDLIPAGSPWYLQNVGSINDAGEIVGFGLLNGEVHAFLATPVHSEIEREIFPHAMRAPSAAILPKRHR